MYAYNIPITAFVFVVYHFPLSFSKQTIYIFKKKICNNTLSDSR